MDDEHIARKLMHLGKGVDATMRRDLGLLGLAPRHGFALQHLCDHGPTSQQALIEALDVDPSVLVAILNDLENAGLAERKRDPEDRRRHIVEMSDRGREALDAMSRVIDGIDQSLLADLSQADVVQLGALLDRLRPPGSANACIEEPPKSAC
ncbi:MarR family winged helix-turn-helix transcriptional regulator [Umezawaea tangerina]|uniref:MarR family transcriptional regulator n=1 Tax=Umezawaea tangerina TaxID=84725 RepID=A0A2T0TKU1_9PSEU|nr:MarR family winged helix-turn-helix transcriptional regulator [Umezawaea tangerina]PRY46257.1 MarR family transcriptional regulator [Umezawaea tangerina]